MNRKEERILNATITLFIKNGIKKTTMDDIAENAKVSKVTIYKYFTDKESLSLSVGRKVLSQYKAELNSIIDSSQPIADKLIHFLDVVRDFTSGDKLYMCGELSKYNEDVKFEYDSYMKTYKETIMSLIEEGKRDRLIRSDIDNETAYYYIDMGLVYYQYNKEYRQKMISDLHFRNSFFSFILGSIFS
ncbi:MAG: TetR/AcrR family transcriptional regulator [Christensenellales bacterium]